MWSWSRRLPQNFEDSVEADDSEAGIGAVAGAGTEVEVEVGV